MFYVRGALSSVTLIALVSTGCGDSAGDGGDSGGGGTSTSAATSTTAATSGSAATGTTTGVTSSTTNTTTGGGAEGGFGGSTAEATTGGDGGDGGAGGAAATTGGEAGSGGGTGGEATTGGFGGGAGGDGGFGVVASSAGATTDAASSGDATSGGEGGLGGDGGAGGEGTTTASSTSSTAEASSSAEAVSSSASVAASSSSSGGGDECIADPVDAPPGPGDPFEYPLELGHCFDDVSGPLSNAWMSAPFTTTEDTQITIQHSHTSNPDAFKMRSVLVEGCEDPGRLWDPSFPPKLIDASGSGLGTFRAPPGTYSFVSCFRANAWELVVEPPPPAPTNVSCATATPFSGAPYAESRVVDATPRYYRFDQFIGGTFTKELLVGSLSGTARVTVTQGCNGTVLTQATHAMWGSLNNQGVPFTFTGPATIYIVIDQVSAGAKYTVDFDG